MQTGPPRGRQILSLAQCKLAIVSPIIPEPHLPNSALWSRSSPLFPQQFRRCERRIAHQNSRKSSPPPRHILLTSANLSREPRSIHLQPSRVKCQSNSRTNE